MSSLASSVLAAAMVVLAPPPCPVAQMPVDGPVVAHFAPEGEYAGHWGIDLAVPAGTPVGAVAAGTVTFAGTVAGMRTVTVDHGRGWKTSLSYLDEVGAGTGIAVARGEVVGRSGLAHGREAVHLSLRIDGRYVDPMLLFRCRVGDIADALWLLPPGDS